MPFGVHNPSRRNLLLAFDAFDTLFTPCRPIAVQYGEIGRRHGIRGFSDEELSKSFRAAFKKESKEHPNYGKETGLAAPEWWAKVITQTFTPFLSHGNILPDQLIPDLLRRFSSTEGYSIYPDVLPFFHQLRQVRERTKDQEEDSISKWPWNRTILGIVTNSDDRVPDVLSSLGLSVGPRRVCTAAKRHVSVHEGDDVNFVVLSYDAGCEKPDRRIFEAAEEMLVECVEDDEGVVASEFEKLYVGDDLEKDVLGAEDAGWNAALLDRKGQYAEAFHNKSQGETVDSGHKDRKIDVVNDLHQLAYWRPSR
ncbi:hypothetical protein LTS18_005053 [Coniosporium uncinatum]|uniref:Uncharacterized protein n=1 Tax=Coniosporium uncinatum TaxID=93489 RepID=A0ACC3D5F0_9PEZI|nr:hypothetical protein LTS18_005053 [Coniosporium uncinatum]